MPPPLPRERRALAITVRESRARKGLTQEELAARAGLGRNYVSEIESGRKRVAFETIQLVARGLDISIIELVHLYDVRLAEELRKSASPPAAPRAARSAP